MKVPRRRPLRAIFCALIGSHKPGQTFWYHGTPGAWCVRCGALTEPIK